MDTLIQSMSSLNDYLQTQHTIPTHCFFIGMVLGVIPMLFSISNYKVEFKAAHYILMAATIIILYWLSTVNESGTSVASIDISLIMLIGLFFSGILASSEIGSASCRGRCFR